jgi:SAM-dependent methyltransferase
MSAGPRAHAAADPGSPAKRDEAILAELAAFARRGEPELLQFGSLAAAYQYRRLYRLWRRHVPAGATVLDWGAGNGHFSYFLSRSGYRATGYSFLPFMFERWLADPAYRFVAGDEREPVTLPFPAASFDAVASIGVLEHVRETGGNVAGSLAEIARVLKPGGVLVVYHFPNRWSWIDRMAKQVAGKHHHLYRYDRGDVRRLIAGAGLEIVETGRYGVLPRNTIHRLFGGARDARWMAEAWDALDRGLNVPFGVIAQNHYVVAHRPGAPARG